MSEADVDLVKALHPPSGTDLKLWFADGEESRARFEAAERFFHDDFRSVAGRPGQPGLNIVSVGMTGLIEGWREWLGPWEAYTTQIDGFVDLGDGRVLTLVRDIGRMRGSEAEVESVNGAVWTVRDGKVAQIHFYTSRDDACAAVGISARD